MIVYSNLAEFRSKRHSLLVVGFIHGHQIVSHLTFLLPIVSLLFRKTKFNFLCPLLYMLHVYCHHHNCTCSLRKTCMLVHVCTQIAEIVCYNYL